jgi:hypothetical protein
MDGIDRPVPCRASAFNPAKTKSPDEYQNAGSGWVEDRCKGSSLDPELAAAMPARDDGWREPTARSQPIYGALSRRIQERPRWQRYLASLSFAKYRWRSLLWRHAITLVADDLGTFLTETGARRQDARPASSEG